MASASVLLGSCASSVLSWSRASGSLPGLRAALLAMRCSFRVGALERLRGRENRRSRNNLSRVKRGQFPTGSGNGVCPATFCGEGALCGHENRPPLPRVIVYLAVVVLLAA